MEDIELQIGRIVYGNGWTNNTQQTVKFQGERLGRWMYYDDDDTRGVTQTLYRAADGTLVVHIEDWSKWQGEPNHSRLVPIMEDDLQPTGDFRYLGAACGMARPLALEEALAEAGGEDG